MTDAAPATPPANENSSYQLPKLGERGTDELIIALVGPIGSGVSECAKILEKELKSSFDYTNGQIIKVSDLITRYSPKVGVNIDPTKPKERTEQLQKAGTEIRKRFGDTAVVDLAIAEISAKRPAPKQSQDGSGQLINLPPESRRHFTIIDSLKHPSEVEQLATVYKDAFWLVGVFAPPKIREERIKDRFVEPEEVVRAMRIDEDERQSSGQKVGDTIELADYFIRNDKESTDNLKASVRRFLDVIFSVGIQTPTQDEAAMYAAAATASKSACLSRQVGAVIANEKGEIIGTGANDVPQFGGGLYNNTDIDHRCFKWGGKICHNDDRKNKLADDAVSKLVAAGVIPESKSAEAKEALSKSQLKGLIEFSRAVHAEMEAIISVARSGANGLVGGTLYSTTFPCHSCARHIVASGIRRVVYIEPYAKSLALDLHKDAISTNSEDKDHKVTFVQYEGVGPKNYIRLFYNGSKRKEAGAAVQGEPREARPVLKEPLDDFATRENIVTGGLKRLSLVDSQN